MKVLFVFILVCISISCVNKIDEFPKVNSKGNKIYYNVEDYVKNSGFPKRKSNFIIVDTSCVSQKMKALSDIKNGKLIFFTDSKREIAITKGIFKKLNIETKKSQSSCLRPGRFEPFCYQEEMQEEIIRRFGQQFIDSIIDVSRRTYINAHPNQAYFEEGVDLRAKYLRK